MLFKKKSVDLPEQLILESSHKTPSVDFNGEEGILSITGRCMPEDAKGFFRPIMEWLDSYKEGADGTTHLKIHLDYFNTSSAKCMLDLLKKVEEIHKEGGTKCSVAWYYMEEDEDMLETGETYDEMIELPFELLVTDD